MEMAIRFDLTLIVISTRKNWPTEIGIDGS